ncbi:uncharacterized protein LOC127148174 [Cucumis melo]|uniref:Uncharacterized protein LOC127148174 n=1 Tax=Cucumis melo TaxID=3656 RepID=A0ABM3KH93_CUCME|nr:uncharacterized protein LOC127148174 [Cucumis melo]
MAVRFEEVSLHQKFRIRWLEFGDQNTALFYHSVRSRMSHNSLLSMVNSGGSRLTSHDGVVQVAVNYFCNSLGLQIIGYRDPSLVIDDIVQFRWFEKCCLALQTPIELEEVRKMLFSIDSGKTPSFDGFSVGFFKVLSRMLNRPIQSFQFHQQCEKRFGKFLDLFANLGKSSMFVVGVSSETASLLTGSMGFVMRLHPTGCASFIQRITSRIRSWAA